MNYEGLVFNHHQKTPRQNNNIIPSKTKAPMNTSVERSSMPPVLPPREQKLQGLSKSHQALWKNKGYTGDHESDYAIPFIAQGEKQTLEGLVYVDKNKLEQNVNAASPKQAHQVDLPKVQPGKFDEAEDKGLPREEDKATKNSVPFLEENKGTGLAQAPQNFPEFSVQEEAPHTRETSPTKASEEKLRASVNSEEMEENLSSKENHLAEVQDLHPSEKSTYTPALYQDALFDFPEEEILGHNKYKPTDFTHPLEAAPSHSQEAFVDYPKYPYVKEKQVVQSSLFEEVAQAENGFDHIGIIPEDEELLDIRSISKRLRKTKDSFLLFEREEGVEYGNI